jgi:hypothetical protein
MPLHGGVSGHDVAERETLGNLDFEMIMANQGVQQFKRRAVRLAIARVASRPWACHYEAGNGWRSAVSKLTKPA